jgi:hypothetical protein
MAGCTGAAGQWNYASESRGVKSLALDALHTRNDAAAATALASSNTLLGQDRLLSLPPHCFFSGGSLLRLFSSPSARWKGQKWPVFLSDLAQPNRRLWVGLFFYGPNVSGRKYYLPGPKRPKRTRPKKGILPYTINHMTPRWYLPTVTKLGYQKLVRSVAARCSKHKG